MQFYILVGILLGATLLFYGKRVDDMLRLDARAFFLFFLPPIIFESGYNLHKVKQKIFVVLIFFTTFSG